MALNTASSVFLILVMMEYEAKRVNHRILDEESLL